MANNSNGKDKDKNLRCSFCGKSQDEVERMIIGPGVNICNECITLCSSLLDEDGAESALPCAIEDREASFTLSFAPEDGEEAPTPIRLIHLRPVSA